MGNGCSSDCVNGLAQLPQELSDSELELDLCDSDNFLRKTLRRNNTPTYLNQINDLSTLYSKTKEELESHKLNNVYLKKELQDKNNENKALLNVIKSISLEQS